MVSASTAVRRPLGKHRVWQWWWLIWVAAGLCVFLCGAALGLASGGGTPGGPWFGDLLSPPFGGKPRVTILLVGVDKSTGRGLADTLIVAVISPSLNEMTAVSIPRDSRVEVPGLGARRINAAHSYGGLPLTVQTVELLLGLPIDYHVEVNVPGIVKLVDAIGGVDIDVDKRMLYHDRSQNLSIDLQPGRQRLNGEQAMGYVRFRHDAVGDIGRMERQRSFLRAVAHKLLSPQDVGQLRELAKVFLDTVDTDLTVKDILALKRIIEQSGPEAIRTATLPGEQKMIRGQSMIELDPVQVQETVDRVLLGQGLYVTVLNGTDIPGLAVRVASRLEEHGCDIVTVDNSSERINSTLVIDHRGQTRRAERVAGWLGRGVISVAPDGDNPADVTVVVGRDLAGAGR
jgi:LCP family protein required for cell wall assembly